MHWPAKIKPNTVFEKPVISLDIFATIKSVINPSLELKIHYMEKPNAIYK